MTKIQGVETLPDSTMTATVTYLERLKAANNGASDYRAAKIIGVTQQTVSKWRSTGTQMSDSIALKVASLLGLPPVEIVASIHAEQAKSEEERRFWSELSSPDGKSH